MADGMIDIHCHLLPGIDDGARTLAQALDLLLRVDARVTGVVVNQLDTRKAAKYSDYGYGGYYESYESRPAAS